MYQSTVVDAYRYIEIDEEVQIYTNRTCSSPRYIGYVYHIIYNTYAYFVLTIKVFKFIIYAHTYRNLIITIIISIFIYINISGET